MRAPGSRRPVLLLERRKQFAHRHRLAKFGHHALEDVGEDVSPAARRAPRKRPRIARFREHDQKRAASLDPCAKRASFVEPQCGRTCRRIVAGPRDRGVARKAFPAIGETRGADPRGDPDRLVERGDRGEAGRRRLVGLEPKASRADDAEETLFKRDAASGHRGGRGAHPGDAEFASAFAIDLLVHAKGEDRAFEFGGGAGGREATVDPARRGLPRREHERTARHREVAVGVGDLPLEPHRDRRRGIASDEDLDGGPVAGTKVVADPELLEHDRDVGGRGAGERSGDRRREAPSSQEVRRGSSHEARLEVSWVRRSRRRTRASPRGRGCRRGGTSPRTSRWASARDRRRARSPRGSSRCRGDA